MCLRAYSAIGRSTYSAIGQSTYSAIGRSTYSAIEQSTDCWAPGSDRLMSPAYSGDGRGRSGSGETQARPKVTRHMTAKYAL